jgi:4-hydroxy-tetrahydrodipicolinate synthase
MVQHALKSEMQQARQLHYQLLRRIDLLFAEGNPTGVKYVLHTQGVCENILRLPLMPATEQLQNNFKTA